MNKCNHQWIYAKNRGLLECTECEEVVYSYSACVPGEAYQEYKKMIDDLFPNPHKSRVIFMDEDGQTYE